MNVKALASRTARTLVGMFQPRRCVAPMLAVVLALPASRAEAAIAFRAASTLVGGNLTSISITRPTGTLANDIMIAQIAQRGGSGTTITAPSGWTPIGSQTNNGTTIGQQAFWKLAGTAAADPGPYIFTLSNQQRADGAIISYSGVHATTPINASGAQANAASTSVQAPSIMTTVANTVLLGL